MPHSQSKMNNYPRLAVFFSAAFEIRLCSVRILSTGCRSVKVTLLFLASSSYPILARTPFCMGDPLVNLNEILQQPTVDLCLEVYEGRSVTCGTNQNFSSGYPEYKRSTLSWSISACWVGRQAGSDLSLRYHAVESCRLWTSCGPDKTSLRYSSGSLKPD